MRAPTGSDRPNSHPNSHFSNLLKHIRPEIGLKPVKFPLFCKKYTNIYCKFCDMSLFPKRKFFGIIYIVKKYIKNWDMKTYLFYKVQEEHNGKLISQTHL